MASYLHGLGYEAGPALEACCAELLAELPPDTTPRNCLGHARHRIERWLWEIAQRHYAGEPVTPAMLEAALSTVLSTGDCAADLLAPAPSRAFLDAFRNALPLALPAEHPLEMPVQSLHVPVRAVGAAAGKLDVPGLAWRRACVFGPTLLSTVAAAWVMQRVFSPGGTTAIEWLLIGLFTLNFLWIALTFWTACLGLFSPAGRALPPGLRRPPPNARPARTAVLMPAYNEDPERVFGGIAAMYESLRATGQLEHFDFFVLSDSTRPDIWVKEEALWNALRQRLQATGRLFYRRRFENTARKAGNIAEFCQRWGGHYEAMLILDADSLMEGTAMVELARILAANPAAGLLQTVPRVVNRCTPFARAQQFAGRLYGPVLARGLAAWHGGDGNYWGHNALIRVRAFAATAGLPVLPGSAPLGGHVLSHDFVEAALMRRAGWGVFMLSDLGGSYEESPPSLLAHAQRDRRWCQGNLQHLAIIGARGLHPLSRLHLLTGIMSYLASPLWFLFLVVGVIAALQTRFELPQYFFPNRTPYPVWHLIDPELAVHLFAVTMGVLVAPKLLGWIAAVASREQRAYGGHLRLLSNVLVETVISALTAPVQMLFQSRFVFEILRGHDSGWSPQARDEEGVTWREAWQRHRHHTFAGVLLGAAAYAVAPPLAAWMAPALLGMGFAAGISYVGARQRLGLTLQRKGVLQIPEERAAPDILSAATRAIAGMSGPHRTGTALASVLADPHLFRLHLALLSRYAPGEVTAPMALAHYRAHHATRAESLSRIVPAALEGAALSSAETLQRLRRGRLAGSAPAAET